MSVRGDPGWLERLLLIFLDNAIKFTPDGGGVSVRDSKVDTNALLTISDTGIGIPSEAISRLFQRFYRVESATSRQTPGTGLGLALAK